MPAILSLGVVRVNMHGMDQGAVLARIRQLCLGLPETSERLSHGAPTFFVRGKRAFVMVLSDHHGETLRYSRSMDTSPKRAASPRP